MVEAQEVEPLGTSCEVHDPGLLGMQPQPEVGEDRRDQLAGPSAWRLVAQRTTRSSAYLTSTPNRCPSRCQRLIQGVQRDVREQR